MFDKVMIDNRIDDLSRGRYTGTCDITLTVSDKCLH